MTAIVGTYVESATSGTTHTFMVPTGVTASMFGVILVGTGSSTAVTITPSSSGATFNKLDEQSASNTRVAVVTFTGLAAGATVTLTLSASATVSIAHYYTDEYTFATSVAASTRGTTSQATTTSGTVTPASGQRVFVLGVERTTAATSVSSVSSSGGEAVTQLVYGEGATVQTSVYLGYFTSSAASSRTVTLTYSSSSANGYAALLLATAVSGGSSGGSSGGGTSTTTTPVIRSSATGAGSSNQSSSFSITKPVGLASGDYMVVLHGADADGALASMTGPSGFTSLGTVTPNSTSNIPAMKIWGKVATSTDVSASSFTFNGNGASDLTGLMIAIQTGTYNTTTPLTLTSFNSQARTSTTTQTAPSATSVDAALLLALFTTDSNGVSQSYPTSGPSGMTRVATVIGGGVYSMSGAYSQVLAGTAATGTKTVSPIPAATTNGWAAVSVVVNPAVTTTGGGGGGTTPTNPTPPSSSFTTPGQCLNIGLSDGQNHFNVGIGTDQHRNYEPSDIAAGLTNANFKLVTNPDGVQAVEFSAPLDGAPTTTNTHYARSELREYDENGVDKIAWNPKTDKNYWEGWSRIMKVPPIKPQVCCSQAHDPDDDTIMILSQLISGKIQMVLRYRGKQVATLDSNYVVGREFYWKMEFDGAGNSKVYYNNPTTPIYSSDTFKTDSNPGWYYKAGCYNQSNETVDNVNDGPFRVQLRSIKHWHTGWPTPQVIGGSGGGNTGGTTGNLPVVSAGADATVSMGETFTRTAVEDSSGVTTRRWSVLSGPAGTGATLSTGPSVSWTPGTAGVYVLRYSATNTVGTATSDATITVGSTGASPPSVDAGLDVSVAVGSTLNQTASDSSNGSAITSRSWMIVSGPSGVGNTLSTTASLSWTPSVAGAYVLQYSATNSAGIANDYVSVSVSSSTSGGTGGGVSPYGLAFPDGVAYPTIPLGTAVVNVSSSAALTSALSSAAPGQKIVLANGTYSGAFTITGKNGTVSSGISIEAATTGGAVFSSGGIQVKDCQYVTVKGLSFPYELSSGNLTQFRGSSKYCRITRCLFGPSSLGSPGTDKAVFVYVGDNCEFIRIDHNDIRNKANPGNAFLADGNFDTVAGVKHIRIDHNFFNNIAPEVTNEKEPIRLGVSTLSRTASNSVVERNYFTQCLCEPEIVSVKFSNVRVSGNTVYRCSGGLVIRHGRNSTMADNYIVDRVTTTASAGLMSGGIRFYDSGHDVLYNYMDGIAGSNFQASLLLDTGDAEGSSTSLSSHWRVVDVLVDHNVILNSNTGIQVGDNYSLAPTGCTVTNNLTAGITSGTPPVTYIGGTTLASSTVNANVNYSSPAAGGFVQDSDTIYRKSGFGPRVTYLKSTDAGVSGDTSDSDGTGVGLGGSSGGGSTPPIVSAGADVSVVTGTTFTRTASETGTGISTRSWIISSGPASVGSTLSTSSSLSWTPTVAGTYMLRYQATSPTGSGLDDAVVTVSGTSSGGGGTATPPAFVNVGSASSGESTSVGVSAPPGVAADDFQICIIACASTETISSVSSGWTLLDSVFPTSNLGTNVPQNCRATVNSDNSILVAWDSVPNATYKLYEIFRSPNGVAGAGALTTTSSLRTPGSNGEYGYSVSSIVGGVESPQSNIAYCALPFGTTSANKDLSGGSHSTWIYYTTSGAAGSASWTKSGSGFYHAVRAAWRGFSALGQHFAAATALGKTHTTPVVDPVLNGSLAVGVVITDLLGGSAGPFTSPSGWTERYDATLNPSGRVEAQSIVIADVVTGTAPLTGSFSSTNADNSAVYAFVLEAASSSTDPGSGGGGGGRTSPRTITVLPTDDLQTVVEESIPGDVVVVSGTHTVELLIAVSGSYYLPIKFQSDPSNSGVINTPTSNSGFAARVTGSYLHFDGITFGNGDNAVLVDGGQHLAFTNCLFRNTGSEGFRIRGNAQYVYLRYCESNNTGNGILNGEGFIVGSPSQEWSLPNVVPDTTSYIQLDTCISRNNTNDSFELREGSHHIKLINCTADFSGSAKAPPVDASDGDSGFYSRANRVQFIRCTSQGGPNDGYKLYDTLINSVAYGRGQEVWSGSAVNQGGAGIGSQSDDLILYINFVVTNCFGGRFRSDGGVATQLIDADPNNFVELDWKNDTPAYNWAYPDSTNLIISGSKRLFLSFL